MARAVAIGNGWSIGRGSIGDFNGKESSFAHNDWTVVEVCGDGIHCQRRRHHNDPKFRPDLLDEPGKAQNEIGFQAAFVKFIQNKRPNRVEIGIVMQHSQEDAWGNDENLSLGSRTTIEANLIADFFTQFRASFQRHPPRSGTGCQTSGFEHHDGMRSGKTGIEKGRWDSGCLSGTGCST